MYTNLKFKLENVNYSRLKGIFFEGYGDTFKQYTIKDRNYLDSLIIDKIKFNIEPKYITCCEITSYGAAPHTDLNTVALNYYIDPSNYNTIFWKKKEEHDGYTTPQLLNEKGDSSDCTVKVYDFSKLVAIDNFVANSHEAYLLDVKQIHSAMKLREDNQVRTMIRWAWDDYDFDTIKNSIKILD
jgi:mannose-6-phosphate isomerase class I